MTLLVIPSFFSYLLRLPQAFVLLMVFSSAMANPIVSKHETNALKDLLLEIEAIDSVIEEAQRRQDHQDRFRFDYRCLIADMTIVKQGLRIAIYNPKRDVRATILNKLCGQYGYVGQQGGEAASLQLLIHELQALNGIIHNAKTVANPSANIQFNYPVLESDIDNIATSIELALLGSGNQPRSFPALRGGFSQ